MEIKYIFRLDFFGEEKTEEATSKRKEDARQEGQVLKSPEVSGALILLSCFLGLALFRGYLVGGFSGAMKRSMAQIPEASSLVTLDAIHSVFSQVWQDILILMLPMLAVAYLASLVVNYAQVGFLFTTKPLKPKLSNLSPIKGIKKLFSKQSVVELFKSIIKIFIAGYLSVKKLIDLAPSVLNTVFLTPNRFMSELFRIIGETLGQVFLALVIIAVADYTFKWFEHRKNLRMSKQEVKEEYKQQEGDPKIKSKRRQRQMEMSQRRMMQAVPKADVIITNPTHFAVALKYDLEKKPAPYLLAKGQDLVAKRIKEIAKENRIPIVENKPLAQTIYKTIEVEEQIPPELYEAVAEVLAYIYSLK